MHVNSMGIRKLAREIFKKYDLTIPVDLSYLLKKLNIDIERCPLSKHIDGMALPVKKWHVNGLIIINSNMIKTRERFTIAHEIGHILKHPLELGNYYLYEPQNGFNNLSVYEREANIFATELLMPKTAVANAFYQQHIQNVEELAFLFMVSKQAMSIRLEELKLA